MLGESLAASVFFGLTASFAIVFPACWISRERRSSPTSEYRILAVALAVVCATAAIPAFDTDLGFDLASHRYDDLLRLAVGAAQWPASQYVTPQSATPRALFDTTECPPPSLPANPRLHRTGASVALRGPFRARP